MSSDSLCLAEPLTVPPPTRPRRVLLVEDNPNSRRVLQIMLQHLGIEPVVAVDGEAGVGAFEAEHFDLILMDLHMPQTDGLEALRKIREIELREGRPHTPIMAATANTMAEDRAACTGAGEYDFISKPVTSGPFLDRVDHWLLMDTPKANEAPAAPTVDPVEVGGEVYDMAILTRLGTDVGEELIPELLAGFEEDLQQHLEAIPVLREAGDTVTLTRTAHSLKSSAATFGAHRLSAVAFTVETHGRHEMPDALYAALPELLTEMHLALEYIPRPD